MRRLFKVDLGSFSVRALNSRPRWARSKSSLAIVGLAESWATSGLSSGQLWMLCRGHQAESKTGSSSLWHSTQRDSGTLCSSHQSSFSSAAWLNNSENLGMVQPEVWPQ